jgi:cysteine dioxygenase
MHLAAFRVSQDRDMLVGVPPDSPKAVPAPRSAGSMHQPGTMGDSSDPTCGVAPVTQFPCLKPIITYLDSLSNRADLSVLSAMLSKLEVARSDIAPACVFGQRGYRRNTISSSPWYELLALCWRSGDCTPIHDHKGVSCAFRIVEGQGTEIRFSPTPSGLICPVSAVKMDPGYICAADEPDIHQVANMQAPGRDLVTLHIYSPPIKKMNTYEFATPISAECADRYNTQGVAAGESNDLPC